MSAQSRLTYIASHLGRTRHKVVVSCSLGPHATDILKAKPELDLVLWPGEGSCTPEWLSENVAGAEGVIVTLAIKVGKEFLDKAGPNLKVVSTASVGYEHVDLAEVKARNIRIGYTPDILTDAVADLTVMLILMAGRNAGETISLVQNGDWPKNTWNMFGFCGPQLSPSPFRPTRTVGFLGFGRIAQATLARLVPFGVQRCLFSANPSSAPDPQFEASTAARLRLRELRRVPRDELARESDVVVVLAPGGAQTHHIVDEAFLCAMKSDAVLVNTSRGTLVDSDALARALREKWIWGAGLDVVEGEPHIGADHPLVKEPRCVILPHIGSATNETRLGMAELAANNVIGGVTGGQMPTELKL